MGPGLCVIPSFYSLSHIIQLSLEDIYYIAFPKDCCIIKWIVLVSLLLETVQTVTMTQNIIHDFIMRCTNPAALNIIGTKWISVPLMTGMSAYKCFYVNVKFKSIDYADVIFY